MKITIEIVEPSAMRYNTVGDWQVGDNNDINITVARSGVPRSDALVGLHEAVEAVTFLFNYGDWHRAQEIVDKFDNLWPNHLKFLPQPNYLEPGDDPASPYHTQHVLATIVERMLCLELGMTWEEHEQNIEVAEAAVEDAKHGNGESDRAVPRT